MPSGAKLVRDEVGYSYLVSIPQMGKNVLGVDVRLLEEMGKMEESLVSMEVHMNFNRLKMRNWVLIRDIWI